MAIARLNTLLAGFLASVFVLWLLVPFAMALLWSLVDPGTPWSHPDMLPPALSFRRWMLMWETTTLSTAIFNSYTLAPVAAVTAIVLAAPTAYAFARIDFPGKPIAQVLTLTPLVLPGFVTAVFFASILVSFGVYSRYGAILLGHVVLFIPYAVRILTVSFAQVNQEVINAARDLSASPWEVFRAAFWPVLKPGVLASFLIVFILSIEEFALAFIVGSPSFTTIPTILFSYLGYDFIRPNAAVVALILVVPNLMLMLVLERLLQSANPANLAGKG